MATLEELAETIKSTEKPPPFNGGDGDNIVLSDDTFHWLGGDEVEEEDPSHSREEEETPSDSDEEKENRDKDMVDKYLY